MNKMSENKTAGSNEDSIEDGFVNLPHKDYLYKILVIGEFGVGKTSIIRRYTEGYFTPNYKLTIGVDFALKTLKWNGDTRVNLQLWDIAGHERFGHMTRVYYKYAIAAIIVFDLSRPATFDTVLKWLDDINSKVMLSNQQPVPVLLLANKCDLETVDIDTGYLEQFCKINKFIGWFPTSAKMDININNSIEFLIHEILRLPVQNVTPVEHIQLNYDLSEEYFEESSDDVRGLRRHRRHFCCRAL